MTIWAWLYMLTVWGAIIALNAFCFSRIFRKQDQAARDRDPRR